ncbi:MAG: hypothetical protein R3C12_01615 [Planctomycetaceae bacterium]
MKTRIPLILSVLLLATCAVTAQAQDDVAVDSDRLCPQVQRWLFRPGTADQIRWQTVEENEASILELEPGGRLLGVESERLVLGEQLAGDHPWRVTAQIRNDGLQQGVFAFSMYCYDQAGKSLKQLVFCGLNERSPKVSWRRTIASFGPGTSLPFPEGTHAVALRFSFYEASGNCQGKVSIRQVGLEPLRVSGQPHWPAEILADVGTCKSAWKAGRSGRCTASIIAECGFASIDSAATMVPWFDFPKSVSSAVGIRKTRMNESSNWP